MPVTWARWAVFGWAGGGGGVSDCVGVWLSSGPFASHSMNSKHLCQTLVQFL